MQHYPYEQKDVQEIYDLIVETVVGKGGSMPKGFKLPFGIHVKRDEQYEVINQVYPKDILILIYRKRALNGDLRRNKRCTNGDLRGNLVYMNGDLRYTVFREVTLYG